jgi:hypothetical protein
MRKGTEAAASFEQLAAGLFAVPKPEVDEQAAEYEKKKERKRKAQVPKDREIAK